MFKTTKGTLDALKVRRDLFQKGNLHALGMTSSYGLLGDSTTVNKSSPIIVGANSYWASLSSGLYAMSAIRLDGSLWTWGYNGYGQLGDNTLVNKSSPVQVGAGTDWAQVSTGSMYSLAIKKNGTLWAWGYNSLGQLGDGTIVTKSSPIQIGTETNWASVCANSNTTLALKTDGTLWSWGQNANGLLGLSDRVSRSSPTQIGSSTDWAALPKAFGAFHTGALKKDGSLWLWGNNTSGQLGDGTIINRSSPVQWLGAGYWTSVSIGEQVTAAIRDDNTLWLVGLGTYGQLGTADINHRSSPVQTIVGGGNWRSVALGSYHALAIKLDGSAWHWGAAYNGCMGDLTGIQSTPTQVPYLLGTAYQVSVGMSNSFFVSKR